MSFKDGLHLSGCQDLNVDWHLLHLNSLEKIKIELLESNWT